MTWIIDGNNVFGSRPDGWWNNRDAAAARLAQQVAEWCRSHGEQVVVVFDAPVAAEVSMLAGGNLAIVESVRRGRDAADDTIVELAHEHAAEVAHEGSLVVVSSDRGLRRRLPDAAQVRGAGAFLELLDV